MLNSESTSSTVDSQWSNIMTTLCESFFLGGDMYATVYSRSGQPRLKIHKCKFLPDKRHPERNRIKTVQTSVSLSRDQLKELLSEGPMFLNRMQYMELGGAVKPRKTILLDAPVIKNKKVLQNYKELLSKKPCLSKRMTHRAVCRNLPLKKRRVDLNSLTPTDQNTDHVVNKIPVVINGKMQPELPKHSSSINGITETVPKELKTNFKHKKICKICSKSFTRLTSLRKHSAKCHPNEPPIPLVKIPTFNRNIMADCNRKTSSLNYVDIVPKTVTNQLPVATVVPDGDIDQVVNPWWMPKKSMSSTPMMKAADPRMLKTSSPVVMTPLSDVVKMESKLMIDE